MIGIIDIGLGNISSIFKVLDKFEAQYITISHASDIELVDKIIFPGVGSFKPAMEKLNKNNLVSPIQKFISDGKHYLGICLGMQLLAEIGLEGEETQGLGVIKGSVKKMENNPEQKLPHIGWNNVKHNQSGIFKNINDNSDFYFVHSYSFVPKEEAEIFYCQYSQEIVAYIRVGNIHGCQFHPEKSQSSGLKLIENFLKC
tara:strand:- start:112 stop:711 length:600 start_codon:yes stop_codon:yes gene_type:complete